VFQFKTDSSTSELEHTKTQQRATELQDKVNALQVEVEQRTAEQAELIATSKQVNVFVLSIYGGGLMLMLCIYLIYY
jgi:Na+-transporting NADH:ubiquinone oxidoreductase subunit NqrC